MTMSSGLYNQYEYYDKNLFCIELAMSQLRMIITMKLKKLPSKLLVNSSSSLLTVV